MTANPSIPALFAPARRLRASINLGNPVLANRNTATGQSYGVSVDLAMEFGRRLGIPVELIVFESASESVEAVSDGRADFGFFAIDPMRAAHIAFTAPYILIEGFYLVREKSTIRDNSDVDQLTNRVAVGSGSAYDLFLSRELVRAQIVRAPTSPAVVKTFLNQDLEVAAGVKQQLESDAANTLGLRLLNERFMVIQQAMGIPISRGSTALAYLGKFVEEMKVTGFVANALGRHQILGASVAP